MLHGMDELDQKIVSALAALRGARAAEEHSPNSETERIRVSQEVRLDELLEAKLRARAPADAAVVG